VTVTNLPASVQARLQNRARETKKPFQELLQYYAMERFLYRLSKSPHRSSFVLKGALMLHVWDAPLARATKDVDLLGRLDNSLENLARVVREICATEVDPDGMVFDPATVKADRIKEDADYEGVRVRFVGLLGKARAAMVLARAISATFANRKTAIDEAPIAFTSEFTEQLSTRTQWTAFQTRLSNERCPEKLSEIVALLAAFLLPVARACATGAGFERRWPPGGPWGANS
jgi:hypothetical protein